ncbi:MAG: hypothetical protein M1821_003301 [Bathelium mastoideum]|nr:MAG: hypothetical protein M1821_003301 [Bathelium mastoideum]
MLPLSPAYLSILERLRNEQASLIDVGCFIGHDLRRLVFDGCPPDRLVGCDIVNHWDLGFEFYRDQDRPFGKHVTYLEDDVLHPKTILFGNENDAHLREKNLKLLNFRGQMDIINASHILHHWDWNDQVRVCKTLVALSKGPQSIIVGCQIGSTGKTKMEPHCKENPYATSETYWHNPDTWKQMWDVIEQETGTKWVTEAKLKTFEEMGWRTSDWWYIGDCARLLQFVVQRIE